MSICSNASDLSVSIFGGDEQSFDDATDQLFRMIQQQLNNVQCSIREIAMSADRGDSFLETGEVHLDICDALDEMSRLFKECKSVSKQVLGPCPKDEKEAYKAMIQKRKDEAAMEKKMAAMALEKAKALEKKD
jgi:hypothetical protein